MKEQMKVLSDQLLGGYYNDEEGITTLQWVKQGGIAGIYYNADKNTLRYTHSINGATTMRIVNASIKQLNDWAV